jgi:uncharacterized HAD superfamily protein
MKILVDIDNVVADFVVVMISYLNVKYDKELKASDVTVWDFVDSPNIDLTKDQFYESLDEYISMNFWTKQPVYKDAREVLERLMKDHCVIYLTSRPASALEATKQSFAKYGLPFNDVYVMENETQPSNCGDIVMCPKMDKGRIADQWKVDVAIEDCPEKIQNYINHGIKVVRKEEPYNDNIKFVDKFDILRSSPNLTEFEKIVIKLNTSGEW